MGGYCKTRNNGMIWNFLEEFRKLIFLSFKCWILLLSYIQMFSGGFGGFGGFPGFGGMSSEEESAE